jgi:hypothetical protein
VTVVDPEPGAAEQGAADEATGDDESL